MQQRRGKTTRNLVTAVGATALLALIALRATQVPASIGRTSEDDRLARGEYLVTVGGCHDCHTPWKLGPSGPEPDMSRMLSGHPADAVMPPAPAFESGRWIGAMADTNTAFSGPWGVSFAANLTPDHSGLGAWDEDIFINTMRTGKHWGQSRPLLPPMPWPNYGRMTDDDLKAVFAYLRSIPPHENLVPLPVPPGSPVVEEDPFWN